MNYRDLPDSAIRTLLEEERKKYNGIKSMGLCLDMTRGKPGADQLDLSMPMLEPQYIGTGKTTSGTECRNYGVLEGIPEARKLMGDLLGVNPENVIVGGNSSLNMMYDTLCTFMLFGTSRDAKPWCKEEKIKWLCPVPGYDRHFLITKTLGFEMIPVELFDDGPDMKVVETFIKDPAVKGMWSIPKYSNPSGVVYSDEVIRKLASMKTAAPDFRIMWDDAYTVHFLGDGPAKQLNMLKACTEAGNPDRAVIFGSTSKITFPGAGLAALASSEANIKYLLSHMTVQTIGNDKLNELRHANFLVNYDGIINHMKKHAEILRPKFKAVLDGLESELGESDLLTWTKPQGGYFISVNTMNGCAKRAVTLAKEAGVKFTPAGATYPYGVDPYDRNIRLAPTLPPIDELKAAISVFCTCVKIASFEKLLEK